MTVKIHPTADIDNSAKIGTGSQIWHNVQIRDGVRIGRHCIIGKGVYIDRDVPIGNNVKIQNYVSIFHGVEIEDGVFIGPHVCFTNDLRPRAISPGGVLKTDQDWQIEQTIIRCGASLGANSTILCGITVGSWALVGAGSVVTKDVPDYGLVTGNPARLRGFVCPCGSDLSHQENSGDEVILKCVKCNEIKQIPVSTWKEME